MSKDIKGLINNIIGHAVSKEDVELHHLAYQLLRNVNTQESDDINLKILPFVLALRSPVGIEEVDFEKDGIVCSAIYSHKELDYSQEWQVIRDVVLDCIGRNLPTSDEVKAVIGKLGALNYVLFFWHPQSNRETFYGKPKMAQVAQEPPVKALLQLINNHLLDNYYPKDDFFEFQAVAKKILKYEQNSNNKGA